MGCIESVDDLSYPVSEHADFLIYLVRIIKPKFCFIHIHFKPVVHGFIGECKQAVIAECHEVVEVPVLIVEHGIVVPLLTFLVVDVVQ